MMRRISLALFFTISALAQVKAQQAGQADSDGPYKVYYNSKNLVVPELIAPKAELATIDNCQKNMKAKIVLDFIVDASGVPRNVVFISPAGSELDIFALKVIEEDQFKPGSLDGQAVAVGLSVEMQMDACTFQSKDSVNKDEIHLKLRSWPEQKFEQIYHSPIDVRFNPISVSATEEDPPYKIGGKVSAPLPIYQPEAEYSKYARKKRIQGTVTIGLIVDAHGMPQNLHLVKGLEASLDENAIEAVGFYRFKPAMIDGRPVAVRIGVVINFRRF